MCGLCIRNEKNKIRKYSHHNENLIALTKRIYMKNNQLAISVHLSYGNWIMRNETETINIKKTTKSGNWAEANQRKQLVIGVALFIAKNEK